MAEGDALFEVQRRLCEPVGNRVRHGPIVHRGGCLQGCLRIRGHRPRALATSDRGNLGTRLLQATLEVPHVTAVPGEERALLGHDRDVLEWYSVWDDAAAASRFASGLERAWAKRRPVGRTARRSEIKQLVVENGPVVRLIDAPVSWAGWRSLPTVHLSARVE